MTQRPTAEQLFDFPGERSTFGPLEHTFDLEGFFEETPSLELSEGFHDLVVGLLPVRVTKSIVLAMHDLRSRVANCRDIERVLGPARQIPMWLFAEAIRQEITTRDGALVGGGRMNLFWIPAAVVVFEEPKDGKWHIDMAGGRRYEKYDRAFFEWVG